MKLFRNLPIQRKLMLIGLITNGLAVVLLSAALGVGEWAGYRGRAATALAVHAGVIADNAASALMFSDEQAAQGVLARLGIETTIVYAALQGRSGNILAQFQIPGQRRLPPALPALEEPLFFSDQLIYAKSVVHAGETVGVLYLQADLREVYWEFLRKLALIAGAMAVSLTFAFFLFIRLQKAISDPIHSLVEAMTRVTRKNDYSVQAQVHGSDELGVLAQGFNAMLLAIREREAALADNQAGLEETVRRRTEELKQLNQSLERRVQEEVAKNREKDHLLIQQSRLAAIGEMIGNIAHQWRQPINALTLLLANIKDAYEFNELDKDYLDKSVRSGQTIIQKMSTTIDDFRNFFRPNKEKNRFSVNEAVADALNILEAAFKNGNIAVALEAEEGVTAFGYRNEYSQVLLNLLTNAKEAIQERNVLGGVIHIAISSRDGHAEVTVEDDAGGIPAEVLPRIFDPYFTTKEKGTGIGLYMSKMIIEHSMDGRIAVENSAGGARFTVVTPAETGCLFPVQVARVVESGDPPRPVDHHQGNRHAGGNAFRPAHQDIVGQVVGLEVFQGVGAGEEQGQGGGQAGRGHRQHRAEKGVDENVDEQVIGQYPVGQPVQPIAEQDGQRAHGQDVEGEPVPAGAGRQGNRHGGDAGGDDGELGAEHQRRHGDAQQMEIQAGADAGLDAPQRHQRHAGAEPEILPEIVAEKPPRRGPQRPRQDRREQQMSAPVPGIGEQMVG